MHIPSRSASPQVMGCNGDTSRRRARKARDGIRGPTTPRNKPNARLSTVNQGQQHRRRSCLGCVPSVPGHMSWANILSVFVVLSEGQKREGRLRKEAERIGLKRHTSSGVPAPRPPPGPPLGVPPGASPEPGGPAPTRAALTVVCLMRPLSMAESSGVESRARRDPMPCGELRRSPWLAAIPCAPATPRPKTMRWAPATPRSPMDSGHSAGGGRRSEVTVGISLQTSAVHMTSLIDISAHFHLATPLYLCRFLGNWATVSTDAGAWIFEHNHSRRQIREMR